MDLRHLKHFIAVAEELHFARAASRLHITQPALSKQIQLLEQELGFSLFYRTKQKVELLDAGHVFLDEARQILRQAENAVESARRTHTGQTGRLIIGFSSSATLEVLPRIVRKYRQLYPEVMLELSEITTVRGSELLLDSPQSVGLIRSPSMSNKKSFSIETIQREPFVVAMPDSHPAAKQDSVRLKTLAEETFIAPRRHPGWDYADAVFQTFRDNRIEPRIGHEVTGAGVLVMLSVVASGLGLALVPASVRKFAVPGVTYRPIKGPSQMTGLDLVWKRDSRVSTLRAFIEVVRAEYPKK